MMPKKPRQKCLVCGKIIDVPPSRRRKYCSRKCFGIGERGSKSKAWKGTLKIRKCIKCGKPFNTYPRKNKKREQKYCSINCCYKYRKKGDGKPKCLDCGKPLTNYNTKRCMSCISKYRSGKNSYNWKGGKPLCLICGRKLSNYGSLVCNECKGEFYIGEKASNWKGGLSFLPYSKDFNKYLKEDIRKRDKYRCQLCGLPQEDSIKKWKQKLQVHHIDYDKNNCNYYNLITVCRKCNSKVNFNRHYWATYFYKKHKVKKLHICSSDIFLIGYENLDIVGTVWKSKKDNNNSTVLSNYYKRSFKKALGNKKKAYISRKFNVLKKWSYKSNSVDEIVIICAIEHFTKSQALFIISEAYRVLKVGGKLLLDFPDLKKDILDYYTTNPEFMMELIYCNQKNDLSRHKWGYTPETFRRMMGPKWDVLFRDIVQHDYPMIGAECTKAE